MPLPSSQGELLTGEVSGTAAALPDLDTLLQGADADASQFWRQQRAAYQRGLLVWLKTPEAPDGLPQMQAAVQAALTRAIAVPEIDEHSESWISFWQAVVTMFDCLGEKQLSADMAVRRLITRIDQHFRRQEVREQPPEPVLLDELRHCIAPFRQTTKIEEALEQADFEIESLELANAEPDIPVLGSHSFPPLRDDFPAAAISLPVAAPEISETRFDPEAIEAFATAFGPLDDALAASSDTLQTPNPHSLIAAAAPESVFPEFSVRDAEALNAETEDEISSAQSELADSLSEALGQPNSETLPDFALEEITLPEMADAAPDDHADDFDLLLDLSDVFTEPAPASGFSLEPEALEPVPEETAPAPEIPPSTTAPALPASSTLADKLPDVVAGILPLFSSARSARYTPEKAEPWKTACTQLQQGWETRRQGLYEFRAAVFGLCAAAVELNDPDCLKLAEALATASDKLELEGGLDNLPLTAAITATLECLGEPDNLEHPAFTDRVRHLAGRLEQCANAPFTPAMPSGGSTTPTPSPRSATIDRLFAEEAGEHLDNLHAALDAVPPQASDAADALRQLAAQADALEIDAISSLGHDLADVLDQLALHASSEDWRILALDLEDILKKQVDTVANGLTPVPQVLEAPLLGALRQLAAG